MIFAKSKLAHAELLFNPYLGLGQSNIVLGDGHLIKGSMQGYLLGLRLGMSLTKSIYVALDYSRGGPYEYQVLTPYYQNQTYPKNIFNIFSGGAGIGYLGSMFSFWYGVYPYHVLNEYNLDYRYTGTLTRFGIGLRLGRDLEAQFLSDKSPLKGQDLSSSARNLACRNLNDCVEDGTYESITFAIGARF